MMFPCRLAYIFLSKCSSLFKITKVFKVTYHGRVCWFDYLVLVISSFTRHGLHFILSPSLATLFGFSKITPHSFKLKLFDTSFLFLISHTLFQQRLSFSIIFIFLLLSFFCVRIPSFPTRIYVCVGGVGGFDFLKFLIYLLFHQTPNSGFWTMFSIYNKQHLMKIIGGK